MSIQTCNLLFGLQKIVSLYLVLLLVYAVLSWVPSLRGAWVRYLAMVIEPVLLPIRRIVPPIGGIDLAFLILAVLVSTVESMIVPAACRYA